MSNLCTNNAMFHTFTPRQWLSIIIYHLQFCPTRPRGFTRSMSRARVTTPAQFLAPTQSTVPNSLPCTQTLFQRSLSYVPSPHWHGWGGGFGGGGGWGIAGGLHHKPKDHLHWWPNTNSSFHISTFCGKTLKQIGDLPDSPREYWRAARKSRHESY